MFLRMHCICSLQFVAGGFLKYLRGIRGNDLQKINVILDLSAGVFENVQRMRVRVVGLFIPV